MNIFKDIEEFYPTPPELIGKMLSGIDLNEIKYILDPSAGKGDLVKFCQAYYYNYINRNNGCSLKERKENDQKNVEKALEKTVQKYSEYLQGINNDCCFDSSYSNFFDMDCVEINQNLVYVLQGKGFRVVDRDFLKFDTEKRYDLIIMNPPFSNGDQHLLKAISLQQRFGGKIICLLNAETIKNPYSNIRKELLKQLNKYDAKFEYVQHAFFEAERKSDVEIVIVKLAIPNPTPKSSRILDELKQEEELKLETSPEFSELAANDYIQNAVIQYKWEIQAGKRLMEEYNALRPLLSATFKDDKEDVPILRLECSSNSGNKYSYTSIDYNDYVKCVRYKYWYELLHNPSFLRNLTSNLKQEYYEKIRELSDYDFSYSNIYQIKMDTLQQMVRGVEDKILELFHKFTYEHSCECAQNVHYFNGWKTNKAFMINKKVIIPWMRTWCDIWKKFEYKYDLAEFLSDIEKTLAFLDINREENHSRDIVYWLQHYEDIQQTKKMQFDYFDITVYKKGTVHITFTNEKLLKKLNIYGCQREKWLPPSYGNKHYDEMSKEEQAVIDEFEGKESYEYMLLHQDKYLVDSASFLALPA